MAIFCIPKPMVEKLKASAIRGEVDVAALYSMKPAERRAFFEKYTDKDLGRFLNTEFEKAMVSKQKTAIADWVESVYTPKQKAEPQYQSVLDKIKELGKLGVLSPKAADMFLEDLVADRLGVRVTAEEVAGIKSRAEAIQEAQKAVGDDLGLVSKKAETIEFFQKKRDMDNYLKELTPAPRLRVITGTIGRGSMLASPQSIVLNIGSNMIIGAAEAVGRRVVSAGLKGTDAELALDYVAMATEIYSKTGYDITRMRTIDDGGLSGSRVLGDTVHSQGPGGVRKYGRLFEKYVFEMLMGTPDTVAAAVTFADSINLGSRILAKGDEKLAREYMEDAMRIIPKSGARDTPAEMLRAQAILDAEVATWTNDSKLSQLTLGMRKLVNDLTGDLRLGDLLDPFVKTGSNVIATGIEYAGGGLLKSTKALIDAARAGDLGNKEQFAEKIRPFVRSGLGIIPALIILSQLNDDDFVGAYDPTRSQIEALRNSRTNSFRIGGHWVSADWLGELAPTVTGMMYARKRSDDPIGMLQDYAYAVAYKQIFSLPVVSTYAEAAQADVFDKNQSPEEQRSSFGNFMMDQVYSHLVPNAFATLARVLDDKERKADQGLEAVIAKIPFARGTLPVKKDIFGEDVTGGNWLVEGLFGSRVKTDKETDLIKEINRVATVNDTSINFTDFTKSTSKQLTEFRERIGPEKFAEATEEYGKKLKELIEEIISKESYKKMSDAEKLDALNAADTHAMKIILKRY